MSDRHDIWAVADALQMDLRAAQAKLVELRARLAQLDLPEPNTTRCPIVTCGIELRGPATLAEHLHNVHDGPMPEHWSRGDAHARAQVDELEEPAL